MGRLVYLAVTRPDLAYTIHILSQYMQASRISHWHAAIRAVRYIKGTPGQGIFLSSRSDMVFTGWCDSDHSGFRGCRRSTLGWMVFLSTSPISWKTKKQSVVSLSSAESEYRAMRILTGEIR